jgi:hypothetical protein
MKWGRLKRVGEILRAYTANEEPIDLHDYNPVPRRPGRKLVMVSKEEYDALTADSKAMRSALKNLAHYLRFCEARAGAICFKAEYADHAEEAEAALAGAGKYKEWAGKCESEMQQFLKDSGKS